MRIRKQTIRSFAIITTLVLGTTLCSWWTNLWTPNWHWEIRGQGIDLLWYLG